MGDRFHPGYRGETTEQLLALEAACRIDSLVLAFEDGIQRKEPGDITLQERYVLAVEALERAVNNGGYRQFFINSSSEFVDVIEEALRAIGCPEVAAITRDAIQGRANEDVLGTCDDRYYAGEEPIADRLFAWIKENKEHIRLGGGSGARADLLAASRLEHLVLHDPAAIPADTPVDPDLEAQEPKLLPAPAMMELAARGQALVVHIAEEDCQARFRVLVDEEPAEEVRRAGEALTSGARLLVPSGVLRADGLEFLCRPGESRPHAEPSETAVPKGAYSMEVLSLLRWKNANRIKEGRRGTTRGRLLVHRLVAVYTWIGIVMIPANLFGAPMALLFNWKRHGWRAAAVTLGVILAIDAVVLGGFWLLDALRRRFPALLNVVDMDLAFEARYPDLVVVLRTAGAADAPAAASYVEARARP